MRRRRRRRRRRLPFGWLAVVATAALLATRVRMTSLQRSGEESDIVVALPRTLALNQVVALRHVANSISSRKSSKVPRPPGERRGREGGREVEGSSRRAADTRGRIKRNHVRSSSVHPCSRVRPPLSAATFLSRLVPASASSAVLLPVGNAAKRGRG